MLENRLKAWRIEQPAFDKLQEPGMIFCTTKLEGNGCKMLRGEDTRRTLRVLVHG